MIQMHGTIGITWEHHAHRYFKRAHGAAQLFGRPGRRRYHQEDLKWISICTRLRATGMPHQGHPALRPARIRRARLDAGQLWAPKRLAGAR